MHDLRQLAFDLNAKHGRALTLQDKKAHARFLIDRYPDLTDREIGRRAGINHETVGSLRGGRVSINERKPGELEADVGLFDPIRRARGATRPQKAIAGYLKRLRVALEDPYGDDRSVEGWADDPIAIAEACFATMEPQRAAELLETLEQDARFLVEVGKARKPVLKRSKEMQS